MELDIQNLVSQLGNLTSEASVPRSSAEGNIRALKTMNDIHSNQLEAKHVLQNMKQAMSRSSTEPSHNPTSDHEVQFATSDHGYDITPIGPTTKTTTATTVSRKSDEKKILPVPVTKMGNRMRICAPECPCTCHVQMRLNTPQFLKQIAGRLFFGYSGHHVLRQQCSRSCYSKDTKTLRLTYFFPSWFANQVISLSMSNTTLNPLTFNRLQPL